MSIFHNNSLAGASGQGGAPTPYTISRSLRFNSADSAYLSRTPASAGNRRTWTWAAWVKRSILTGTQNLFTCARAANTRPNLDIYFDLGVLTVVHHNGTAVDLRCETAAQFRDPSAWYHFVIAVDTTQATAANRVKIYVNGTEQTLSTATYPAQNALLEVNNNVIHNIGRYAFSGVNYFNGYLTDVHLVDGQALTPTSFGEFSATTGVWMPKVYTGSYGTNGFKLNFSNNSAATDTTLGQDSSGNANNWTPTNFSVTAGIGNDSFVDSPTNGTPSTGGDVGGVVRGNYCTLNSNSSFTTVNLSNGNLEFTTSSSGVVASSTFAPTTGKWYWEAQTSGGSTQAQAAMASTVTGTASLQYNFAANGTVYGFEFDADAGIFLQTADGVNYNTIATGLTGVPYTPNFRSNGTASKTITVNFGQRPFTYGGRAGVKSLCSTNLPTPTIVKPSTVMDVVLYTGTGATLTPTSTLGFEPDLVWIKSRSAATHHALYDSVRGAQTCLESSTANAQVTSDNGVTAFNTAGFTLGTLAQVNTNAATYAAWAWDAGSSTVTNTTGTISSQVRANSNAGFSVVTYTGTGANATVGHGLGAVPGMVIVKRLNAASNWQVRHPSVLAASSIQLNLTGIAASAPTVWNSTAPSSTVFSIGTDATVNSSTATYVAYCFAPVIGYSAFSYYGGNNNASGPFVYTEFRPRFIMLKRITGAANNWIIIDSAREGYNVDNNALFPNLISSESTTDSVDILSNGFRLRTSDATVNASGDYMYAAFAESPFSLARAR
jgi:hypothetical protein